MREVLKNTRGMAQGRVAAESGAVLADEHAHLPDVGSSWVGMQVCAKGVLGARRGAKSARVSRGLTMQIHCVRT